MKKYFTFTHAPYWLINKYALPHSSRLHHQLYLGEKGRTTAKISKYVHFSIELRLTEMGKLLVMLRKKRKYKFSSFYLHVRRRIK